MMNKKKNSDTPGCWIMNAKQVKVFSKENKLAADEVLNFTVKNVVFGDETNDFRNDVSDGIDFVVRKNGSLYLYARNGDSNSVWFEPNKLDFLERALDAALAQREKANS